MPDLDLAANISEFVSQFPPGCLQLEAVQVSLTDIPQHYIVAAGGNSLYVAFMGTKQARDIVTDVNALHEPVWAEAAALAADKQALPAAHRGFLSRARAINVEQLYELAVSSGRRLVMCGHSLGGAVAKLCTLRLLREAPDWPAPRVRCITFATPAVGNAALADMVVNAGWDKYFASYYLPEDQLVRLISFSQQTRTPARPRPPPQQQYRRAATQGDSADSGSGCIAASHSPPAPASAAPAALSGSSSSVASLAASDCGSLSPGLSRAGSASSSSSSCTAALQLRPSSALHSLADEEQAMEEILSAVPLLHTAGAHAPEASDAGCGTVAAPAAAAAAPAAGDARSQATGGGEAGGAAVSAAAAAAAADALALAAVQREALTGSSSGGSWGIRLAVDRKRLSRHVQRMAAKAKLPLPTPPVASYHLFGGQWFITTEGALTAQELAARQGSLPAATDPPGGSKGFFSFHRMLAYRHRFLEVLRHLLPLELPLASPRTVHLDHHLHPKLQLQRAVLRPQLLPAAAPAALAAAPRDGALGPSSSPAGWRAACVMGLSAGGAGSGAGGSGSSGGPGAPMMMGIWGKARGAATEAELVRVLVDVEGLNLQYCRQLCVKMAVAPAAAAAGPPTGAHQQPKPLLPLGGAGGSSGVAASPAAGQQEVEVAAEVLQLLFAQPYTSQPNPPPLHPLSLLQNALHHAAGSIGRYLRRSPAAVLGAAGADTACANAMKASLGLSRSAAGAAAACLQQSPHGQQSRMLLRLQLPRACAEAMLMGAETAPQLSLHLRSDFHRESLPVAVMPQRIAVLGTSAYAASLAQAALSMSMADNASAASAAPGQGAAGPQQPWQRWAAVFTAALPAQALQGFGVAAARRVPRQQRQRAGASAGAGAAMPGPGEGVPTEAGSGSGARQSRMRPMWGMASVAAAAAVAVAHLPMYWMVPRHRMGAGRVGGASVAAAAPRRPIVLTGAIGAAADVGMEGQMGAAAASRARGGLRGWPFQLPLLWRLRQQQGGRRRGGSATPGMSAAATALAAEALVADLATSASIARVPLGRTATLTGLSASDVEELERLLSGASACSSSDAATDGSLAAAPSPWQQGRVGVEAGQQQEEAADIAHQQQQRQLVLRFHSSDHRGSALLAPHPFVAATVARRRNWVGLRWLPTAWAQQQRQQRPVAAEHGGEPEEVLCMAAETASGQPAYTAPSALAATAGEPALQQRQQQARSGWFGWPLHQPHPQPARQQPASVAAAVATNLQQKQQASALDAAGYSSAAAAPAFASGVGAAAPAAPMKGHIIRTAQQKPRLVRAGSAGSVAMPHGGPAAPLPPLQQEAGMAAAQHAAAITRPQPLRALRQHLHSLGVRSRTISGQPHVSRAIGMELSNCMAVPPARRAQAAAAAAAAAAQVLRQASGLAQPPLGPFAAARRLAAALREQGRQSNWLWRVLRGGMGALMRPVTAMGRLMWRERAGAIAGPERVAQAGSGAAARNSPLLQGSGAGTGAVAAPWHTVVYAASCWDPVRVLRSRDMRALAAAATAASCPIVPVLLSSPAVPPAQEAAVRQALASACGVEPGAVIVLSVADEVLLPPVGAAPLDAAEAARALAGCQAAVASLQAAVLQQASQQHQEDVCGSILVG